MSSYVPLFEVRGVNRYGFNPKVFRGTGDAYQPEFYYKDTVKGRYTDYAQALEKKRRLEEKNLFYEVTIRQV